MPLCVVTVDVPATAHGARHQEAMHVARALALASHAIQGAAGSVIAGDILDTGAVKIGSWILEPQAAKIT
jgi:hypothetical protein